MNYKIEWSSKSVSDLAEHVSFQRRVSIDVASTISLNIISAALSLSSFPERFPEFTMLKNFPVTIRKCVVDSRYIILYGITDDIVMIYRILDARRKFDGLLN